MAIDMETLQTFLAERLAVPSSACLIESEDEAGVWNISARHQTGAAFLETKLAFIRSVSPFLAEQEFNVRLAAWEAGVQTSRPLWPDMEGMALGVPGFFVEGEVPVSVLGDAGRLLDEDEGDQLAFRIGQDLARMHKVRMRERPERLRLLVEVSADWARNRASVDYAILDRAGVEHPILELALAWFVEHAPKIVDPVLTHGDFRPRQIILRDGQTLITGFSKSRWSDPLEDIGAFCARVNRGHAYVREAGGIGARDVFYDGYRDVAGPSSIDPENVRFWEFAATLDRAIALAVAAARSERTMAQWEMGAPPHFLSLEAQYDLLMDMAG